MLFTHYLFGYVGKNDWQTGRHSFFSLSLSQALFSVQLDWFSRSVLFTSSLVDKW